MTAKRTLPFFMIMIALTLSGCFRQATDSFDTVDNQGSSQVINTQAPTVVADVTIIAPDATAMPDTETQPEPTTVAQVDVEPTPTIMIIQPTESVPATATNIPAPTTAPVVDTVPTATQQTVITPETDFEVVIPTATPTEVPVETEEPLEPTPTTLPEGEDVVAGDCEYIVQTGDNPFRIALNNNVLVDDLMALNSINPYAPIIQPGQVLQIPDCVPGEEPTDETTAGTDTEATTDTTDAGSTDATETVVEEPAESDEVVHVVAAGEGLLGIARQYGVTVNEILRANPQIVDPNRIGRGDELVIPTGEDEADSGQ